MAGYWTFCLTLGFFQLEKDIVSNWLLSSKAKCFVNSVTVIANLKSALTRERFTDKHTSDCHGGAEVDNQRAEQWLLESCVLAEEAGVLASGWLFHCCPGSAELSGTTWIWQDAGRAEDKVKFMGEKQISFVNLKILVSSRESTWIHSTRSDSLQISTIPPFPDPGTPPTPVIRI